MNINKASQNPIERPMRNPREHYKKPQAPRLLGTSLGHRFIESEMRRP